jgi:GTP-sensing pleiotropic transcriptional regulator CodY
MKGESMDHTSDLQEIAEEIAHIEYGELHIMVRGGKIIGYTTIKSKLKQSDRKKRKNQIA